MANQESDNIKILYVEDDPQARELLEKLLRHKYPSVVLYTASDGEGGLKKFSEHRPDLVITDINMPLLNGVEMSKQVKEQEPDVLIIAISAYHNGDFVAEAAKVGFQKYVTKPVEYRKLLEAIDDCIQIILQRKRLK